MSAVGELVDSQCGDLVLSLVIYTRYDGAVLFTCLRRDQSDVLVLSVIGRQWRLDTVTKVLS